MNLRIIISGGVITPLPPLEAAIMADLWAHGAASVPAMAQRLGRGDTTISTTLYRMARRGLVVNRHDYQARWAPAHDRAAFDRAVVAAVQSALDAYAPDAVAGLIAGRAG